jgi:site-specific DNA recombinase
MRAAIYARYSTDLQRDKSIADQVRTCEALIKKEHWTLVAIYTDRAITGTARLRPDYQKLLEHARNNQLTNSMWSSPKHSIAFLATRRM